MSLAHPTQVALITEIDLILGEAYTVEWDLKIRDEEKIDCFPDESGASAANCTARGCAWEVTVLTALKCIEILGQPGWLSGLVPPSAQGLILETWDRVPCPAPCMEPSPSACVSTSFSVFLVNK